jgi:predicted DsbA family dithiol-disulfide isomerase
MDSSLKISYFTDVLCVWAWIGQRRVEELQKEWGDKVLIRHYCVNFFGDTSNRIGEKWAKRGSYEGFGQHVFESAAPYETAPVNPQIWRDVRPRTSATAHLVMKAAELVSGQADAMQLATALRKSFFVNTLDIGNLDVVLQVAGDSGLDRGAIMSRMETGEPQAALMADLEASQELRIKGSPSWVMNNGRQILYGNVGYRVLSANVEELLSNPEQEASWC